ncbi:hypothetical protein [Nitrosopumilus piranensis]|uniref:hypothetical protein n=1 Tax=Nitrosopumilus piranensis TaxID=1582439 RepID=UPI0011E59E61|nr:hypothetical protein [Nitrosopumilus piranensis]
MNFLSKKVVDFQKKKLDLAEGTLKKYIQEMKEFENTGDSKGIKNHKKMIKIWTQNIEKIKKEIKKIESR